MHLCKCCSYAVYLDFDQCKVIVIVDIIVSRVSVYSLVLDKLRFLFVEIVIQDHNPEKQIEHLRFTRSLLVSKIKIHVAKSGDKAITTAGLSGQLALT